MIGGCLTWLLNKAVLSEGCPHNYYRSMSTTIYRRVVHIIIIRVCPLIYIGGLLTYLLSEYVHYNISEGCPHNYYQSMSTNLY